MIFFFDKFYKAGLDLNKKDTSGYPMIVRAAKKQHTELVDALAESGTDKMQLMVMKALCIYLTNHAIILPSTLVNY